MEEPGVLQSMGSQRVGHNLATGQQQAELRVGHVGLAGWSLERRWVQAGPWSPEVASRICVVPWTSMN